jgi:hypothetical protein
VQTVGEEVIGIPEPMRPEHEYCFGGVLLPTKDNFYTVRDGLLSEYQIKPFKRVRSVVLETDLLKKSGLKDCKMWTNHDHSKVIVYNDKVLLLLDAMTGRLLKSRVFQSEMRVHSAQIEGDEIFLLAEPEYHYQLKYKEIDDPYQLMVWDIDTLEERESIRLKAHAGIIRNEASIPDMLVYHGRIYITSEKKTIILGREGLELQVSMPGTGGWNTMLSDDGDVLYVKKELNITYHQVEKEIKASPQEGDVFLLYISKMDGRCVEDTIENRDRLGLRRIDGVYNQSQTKEFTMLCGMTLRMLTLRKRALLRVEGEFFQYEHGEAIWLNMEPVTGIGWVVTEISHTPNARKYLYMRVDRGPSTPSNEIKIVPINDATYKKFVTR